jgi:hypothetical protein
LPTGRRRKYPGHVDREAPWCLIGTFDN